MNTDTAEPEAQVQPETEAQAEEKSDIVTQPQESGTNTTTQTEDKNRGENAYYVRFGGQYENRTDLAEDSKEAKENGRPHGISVWWKKRVSGSDKKNKSAPVSVAHANFQIVQSGSSPNHFTVIFSEPVTEEEAVRFNTVFTTRDSN